MESDSLKACTRLRTAVAPAANFMRLHYADGARLYVPLERLDSGAERIEP